MSFTDDDETSTTSSDEEITHQDQSKGQNRFACNQCDKTYKTKWSLKYHRNTHLAPDVRKKYPCDQCDGSYPSKGSLTKHIESVHRKIKPATCGQCEKSFRSKWHLEIHSQSHINPNKRPKFHCQECRKHFFSEQGLTGHVNAVHRKLEELTCTRPGCGFIATDKWKLIRHAMSHTKVCSFSCPAESCFKLFKTKSGAEAHYRKVHLKVRHPCPLASCNRTYVNRNDARDHYRREHGGDTAKWRCPHCDQLYASDRILLVHIDEVHKKIRFNCQTCYKSYCTKAVLSNHICKKKNH